ncbi:hypothetical protein Pryu01_00389 [Paraliobacillus ryukyuensis]|uniref:Prephenate dehydrogenase n=1 Tax=Paraliobacillus ryukyuensis TaxID=200904 RepID=A0A366EJ80_9BACI|nr:prephenate dehydrogenase [Paraliobacillus ryukyuensis]RBP01539.1 prephenate dehydrogenase [Paraliobacillus ryukyuensis]
MTKKILIVGLGLIGASLAINIKKQEDTYLIGYDTDEETLEYAQVHQIVNEVTTKFTEKITDVDYCLLAAPVSKTVDLIKQIQQISFNRPIIITDVSSVKQPIMDAVARLDQPNVSFIGGHPMAGSHKKGIHAAKEHLFENALYILTPDTNATDEQMEALKRLLAHTKSSFLQLNPTEHDEMTSVISHFPHLIASSLVQQAKKWQKKHDRIPHLAAGGFRDITRIASSNPAMWQDIFFQNKKIIHHLLTDWINEMQDLQKLLTNDDRTTMYDYLKQAKEYRDGLDARKRGALPSFYDVYVDIFDQTGALLKVVSILAEGDISIKNIEILEIREGITGVLRVSLMTQKQQVNAHQLLTKHGYETMLQE